MPQIKDVFDIDKAIAEHGNKILLLGGVGSGKSTWVAEVLTKKGSVLFVTSRKAKVLEDKECTCFSDAFRWYTDSNQTLITNAKLAALVENISEDSMKDIDEFIEHFDYIVVDEVHSIATDSAYAESCASVLSFIEYIVDKGKNVVCMTGTPEPVQAYFDENGWYTVDYIDVCSYVHPKRVSMLQGKYTVKYLKEYYPTHQIIYFANHKDTIISLCKTLLDNEVLPATEIAVSVSKNSEKKFFEDLGASLTYGGDGEVIKAASQRAYENIVLHKCLPDNCKILFSTSVLKEGINIRNSGMVTFCENHILSNLIQYFGRVREGGTEVYVIEDSEDHTINNSELLYRYAIDAETDAANRFYRERIECTANPFTKAERRYFTNHVSKNPYIYFDYLTNRYRVFDIKFREEVRLKSQRYWKNELLAHCKRYGIEQRWFDDIPQKKTLLDLAKKKQRFWGASEKEALLNLLYVVYDVKAKQPKGINRGLEDKNASIRVYNGKGTAGSKRNKSYWQLFFVEDYEAIAAKR